MMGEGRGVMGEGRGVMGMRLGGREQQILD